LITSQYLVGFDISRKKADNWWLASNYLELVRKKRNQYNYAPGNESFMIGVIQKNEGSSQRPGKSKESFKALLKMVTKLGLPFLRVYVQTRCRRLLRHSAR
jgi:hypothetical protein